MRRKYPPGPLGLRVTTEAGSLDVAVSWNAVEGASSYKVRWRRSGPGNALNEGVVTQSPNAVITVSDYGRWVVRVEGCNDAGCGPGVSKAVLIRQAKPERPQNLTVSATTGRFSWTLTATWDTVEAKAATSYKVRWRRPQGNFADGRMRPRLPRPTPPSRCRSTASGRCGWRAATTPVAAPAWTRTVDVVLPKPGRPENLAVATKDGSLDALADWDDVAWATSYAVHWGIVVPDTGVNWRVSVRTSEASCRLALRR